MKRLSDWAKARADALVAAALFGAYVTLLVATAGSLGFMRDEGFYFAASRAYGDWFELLLREPGQALSRAVVDRHWAVNHEHPSLIKSLFALSNQLLSGAFRETSLSFRFPAMLLSGLAVAVIYLWGRRVMGRAAALLAALSFAFLPRVFFHAHLACFDLPVCALWLVTCYVYARSLESRRLSWAVAAGVCYGLLLDTKHNSWLLPFVLLGHFALTRGVACFRDLRQRRIGEAWRRLPLAWPFMLLLGPLVFYALWPWIWHDTWVRLREYVAFHTGHEFYNMEFLGRTYWKPPMPLGYAWLMTLATVPFVTLALFGVGLVGAVRLFRSGATLPESGTAALNARSDVALWAIALFMSYAPWLSTNTPIFGGTKHWLTAYPFLCLLAGLGFAQLKRALGAWLSFHASRDWALGSRACAWLGREPVLAGGLLCCGLAAPLAMTVHSHPFGLSAYTPLVGGAPGAASLGLNRTFWGYTTASLSPFINQRAPRRAGVYVHDTALQSFAMLQEDGRLRPDLRGGLSIAKSRVALYHHEPHMSRVEHQIWLDYGSLSPDAITAFDGVPVAWVYLRKP